MWATIRAWKGARRLKFGDNFCQTLSPTGCFTDFSKYSKVSSGLWPENSGLLPGEADRISVVCEEGRGKRGGFLGRGNSDPSDRSMAVICWRLQQWGEA